MFLHAALTFHQYLPVEVFEHALDHYINEINEVEDKTGRTPLHIAASSKIGESIFLEIMDAYANNVNGGGKKNLLIPQENLPRDFVVAATTRDRYGRLPLFIALENGYFLGLCKGGVIERLLSADQSSFTIRDESTGLFPFMLAAMTQTIDLDSLFKITMKSINVVKLYDYCNIDKSSSLKRKRTEEMAEIEDV